jgi:hypothetical protein
MADAPGQTLEMRAGVATREPRTALSGGRAVEEEGGGGFVSRGRRLRRELSLDLPIDHCISTHF